MARRLANLALLTIAGFLGAAVEAQQPEAEPLAPELVAAKTIFVKQTLIDPKIVSRFRSEIGKLDRFSVTATEAEADLVATLSATAEYEPSAAESQGAEPPPEDDDARASSAGLRPMGTVRVLEDLYLTLVTPAGEEVWTDSVPLGSLTGNAAKKLARRLEERLEEAAD